MADRGIVEGTAERRIDWQGGRGARVFDGRGAAGEERKARQDIDRALLIRCIGRRLDVNQGRQKGRQVG